MNMNPTRCSAASAPWARWTEEARLGETNPTGAAKLRSKRPQRFALVRQVGETKPTVRPVGETKPPWRSRPAYSRPSESWRNKAN